MSDEWSEKPDLMLFPSGAPVSFEKLVDDFGLLNQEKYDDLTAQFAAMQAQIDAARADMQRQIDELRGVSPAVQAATLRRGR